MRKLIVMLISALFIIGISVASYAEGKKDGDMPSHKPAYNKSCEGKHSHMFMFKKLGLSDTQREAIRAIHSKNRKEMIRKIADIKVAKIELMEILSKDSVDMAMVETAVKKIESLRVEMKMMRIKAMEEIKSNLNDEQKKKFRLMMMKHFMMKKSWKRCGCQGHHMGGLMRYDKERETHHANK